MSQFICDGHAAQPPPAVAGKNTGEGANSTGFLPNWPTPSWLYTSADRCAIISGRQPVTPGKCQNMAKPPSVMRPAVL